MLASLVLLLCAASSTLAGLMERPANVCPADGGDLYKLKEDADGNYRCHRWSGVYRWKILGTKEILVAWTSIRRPAIIKFLSKYSTKHEKSPAESYTYTEVGVVKPARHMLVAYSPTLGTVREESIGQQKPASKPS